MDKERAQTILSRVIEKNKKEERVIISQSNNIVPNPHNGITSKTAEFIDSINDEQTMAKIVDEISDRAIKLIKRVDENV